MFENVVSSIITAEFESSFGRDRKVNNTGTCAPYRSDPFRAMQVKFSLSPDYDREDGYRNLTILIFGGGMNYIGVFAKLDWTVTPNTDVLSIERESENPEYTKGETPWVLQAGQNSFFEAYPTRHMDERLLKYHLASLKYMTSYLKMATKETERRLDMVKGQKVLDKAI